MTWINTEGGMGFMKFLLLGLMLLLLIICFIFQIRDIYFMKEYKRTSNSNFECGYLKRQITKKGYTISECENIFCKKNFEKNKNSCPQKCRGRVYSDAPQNLEILFSSDRFYFAKKIAYLSGTFFAGLLTVLNIMDKL